MIKKMKFPPAFDTKVDMRKVELAVMKPWIAKKTVELLGFEDDVLIEYISSLLEDQDNPVRPLTALLLGGSRAVAFRLTLAVHADRGRQEDATRLDGLPPQANAPLHDCALDSPPLSSIQPPPRPHRAIGGEEEGDARQGGSRGHQA